MDEIVYLLNKRQEFPHLARISIVGFSAGAQFVNRYSWASDVGENGGVRGSNAHTLLHKQYQVPVKFIAGSSNSYLYFTPERPADECIPDNSEYNVASNKTRPPCRKFIIPEEYDSSPEAISSGRNNRLLGLASSSDNEAHDTITNKNNHTINYLNISTYINDTSGCPQFNNWAMGLSHMPWSRFSYMYGSTGPTSQVE